MKPEELRIGNLVNVCYSDKRIKLTKVKSIHEKGVNIFATSCGDIYAKAIYNYEAPPMGTSYKAEAYILPIPLTEEWLHDFGFELDNGFTTYKIDVLKGYLIVAVDGSWGLYKDEYSNRIGSSYNNTKDIKYVHELQNFYFALTGEELKFDEL
jgi:hypothetical protein